MIPRPEYPRPDFERKNWMNLNGEWDFYMGGEKESIFPEFDQKIMVPFCYESKLSGIGQWADCEAVWYQKVVELTEAQLKGAVLLHFGAVDYEACVWVNDTYIGNHLGGHISFSFDISHGLQVGKNTITVKAIDSLATDKPRGKQSWQGRTFGCWYTPTTGIWQTVWLEFTGKDYIKHIKLTPDIDALSAECEVIVSTNEKRKVVMTASYALDKVPMASFTQTVTGYAEQGYARGTFSFKDLDFLCADYLFWTPEQPHLVDVKVELLEEDVLDTVDTYFGMRKISVQNGRILLNNNPYYQRLILDQGYWEASLLTPPSDQAIIDDIKLTKEMGFNGARKHQKIEDPRYYYWADKLGLLVWGELPSPYRYNSTAVINATKEMSEFIMRDYNHPCIITWATLNESWGVRGIVANKQRQDFAQALYYVAKSLDQTRLVSSNDGWEQPDACDICAIHDYALFQDNTDKYDDMQKILEHGLTGKMMYAAGSKYAGQPILMTEYGGIAFSDTADEDWGYFGKVKTEEEFLKRLEPVTDIFVKSRAYSGFCYTQLTDVMQEVNGLLTADRKPKVAVEKLSAIFGKQFY
ncbi:MAG: glycoside hydrolase family 2 [Lachnospiraceae bacterium]|nr:glycoside hydrolase family 2 [Lachnospiraceae bacterium]